jgi:D-ribose pyranose/furanose isomerase RbsD
MKKAATRILVLSLALAVCGASRARGQESIPHAANWQVKVNGMLPLLGHRNWILIVDSAYPLQISPGIETIETGEGLPEVTSYVLKVVDRSIHVRPDVYMDAELPFIAEADAPEVSRYQSQIRTAMGDRKVISLPHEQLLQKISEAGSSYKILVLKTNETIPYTSVFLRLNCKYWSDEAEARLREAMKHRADSAH